jgi:hypothetical protein
MRFELQEQTSFCVNDFTNRIPTGYIGDRLEEIKLGVLLFLLLKPTKWNKITIVILLTFLTKTYYVNFGLVEKLIYLMTSYLK